MGSEKGWGEFKSLMISLSCVCVECGWFKFLVFYLFSCASSSFSAIYRSRYHLFFFDNVHSHRSRPPPCFVVSGGWFISKSGSIPSGYSTERSPSLSLSLDFQNFGRKKEKKIQIFFPSQFFSILSSYLLSGM